MLKVLFFSLSNCLGIYVQNELAINVNLISTVSFLFHVYLYAGAHYLDSYTFMISLEIGKLSVLQMCEDNFLMDVYIHSSTSHSLRYLFSAIIKSYLECYLELAMNSVSCVTSRFWYKTSGFGTRHITKV